MAGKKPASKPKKPSKPAAARAPASPRSARKSAGHKAEPRREPASSHRTAAVRDGGHAHKSPAHAQAAKNSPKPAGPVALKASGVMPKATVAGKPVGAPAAKPVPVPTKPAAAAAVGAGPAKSATAAPKPAPPPKLPAASTAAPRAFDKAGVMAIGVSTRTGPRPVADTEENDSPEPGSLAGPRNVKPYIAKRGEQYMGKQQLGHFQQILETWKRDLMEEVDRTVSHMKDEAANFPDPNDRATQEEEFSLELRTRDRERKLIRKIEEALKRIEDGSYGYCLETGEEIGIKRLEARPVATLSIEAQERRERRERQYGDRDDRYR